MWKGEQGNQPRQTKDKNSEDWMLVQVDAALDLSHTQNIGYVLKNHFARSQFLVVGTVISSKSM